MCGTFSSPCEAYTAGTGQGASGTAATPAELDQGYVQVTSEAPIVTLLVVDGFGNVAEVYLNIREAKTLAAVIERHADHVARGETGVCTALKVDE